MAVTGTCTPSSLHLVIHCVFTQLRRYVAFARTPLEALCHILRSPENTTDIVTSHTARSVKGLSQHSVWSGRCDRIIQSPLLRSHPMVCRVTLQDWQSGCSPVTLDEALFHWVTASHWPSGSNAQATRIHNRPLYSPAGNSHSYTVHPVQTACIGSRSTCNTVASCRRIAWPSGANCLLDHTTVTLKIVDARSSNAERTRESSSLQHMRFTLVTFKCVQGFW